MKKEDLYNKIKKLPDFRKFDLDCWDVFQEYILKNSIEIFLENILDVEGFINDCLEKRPNPINHDIICVPIKFKEKYIWYEALYNKSGKFLFCHNFDVFDIEFNEIDMGSDHLLHLYSLTKDMKTKLEEFLNSNNINYKF